jgi:protein-disulfide isomerase
VVRALKVVQFEIWAADLLHKRKSFRHFVLHPDMSPCTAYLEAFDCSKQF